MSLFYGRRWEITLDDEVFIAATDGQDFKMVFAVLIDFGGYTSYADIAIYNLNQTTSNKVLKKGKEITLKAGYVDNIDFIFKGNINNVLRERDGANTITRLIARGGSLPSQRQLNTSFGENTNVVDIIRECVSATGYKIDITPEDFSDISPYIRGYTLNGDPRVYLDSLAKSHSFSYTFDGDRIVIMRNDSFRPGSPVIISQFNGMEGIPEITEEGVDVTVRLNPKIKIGSRVDIQSILRTFNFNNLYFQDIPELAGTGLYKTFRIRHEGDTKGDVWSSKITGYRQR